MVKARSSGANQERVATEVSNAQSGQLSAGAEVSVKEPVANIKAKLVVDKKAEQALAKKFEQTWFSNAMAECRAVLTPEVKSNPKAPAVQSSKPDAKVSQAQASTKPAPPTTKPVKSDSLDPGWRGGI
jgi:hypothetical protein